MNDFPGTPAVPVSGFISTCNLSTPAGQYLAYIGANVAAAVWPVANKAIYTAAFIPVPVVARQMSVAWGAVAAGTVDAGIYDEAGTRVVSSTATAIPGSAGVQVFNITDTELTPGIYFIAFVCSIVATATLERSGVTATAELRPCGVQEQTLGAPPAVGTAWLPATATFATLASGYCPKVGVHVGSGVAA